MGQPSLLLFSCFWLLNSTFILSTHWQTSLYTNSDFGVIISWLQLVAFFVFFILWRIFNHTHFSTCLVLVLRHTNLTATLHMLQLKWPLWWIQLQQSTCHYLYCNQTVWLSCSSWIHYRHSNHKDLNCRRLFRFLDYESEISQFLWTCKRSLKIKINSQ